MYNGNRVGYIHFFYQLVAETLKEKRKSYENKEKMAANKYEHQQNKNPFAFAFIWKEICRTLS